MVKSLFLLIFGVLFHFSGAQGFGQYSFTVFDSGWFANNFFNLLVKQIDPKHYFSDMTYKNETQEFTITTFNTSSFALYFGSNSVPSLSVSMINETAQNITIKGLKISLFTEFSLEFTDGPKRLRSDGSSYGSLVFNISTEFSFNLSEGIFANVKLVPEQFSFITEKMNPIVRQSLSESFLSRSKDVMEPTLTFLLQNAVDKASKAISESIKTTNSTFLNQKPFSIGWDCMTNVNSNNSVLVSCYVKYTSQRSKEPVTEPSVFPSRPNEEISRATYNFQKRMGSHLVRDQASVTQVSFQLNLIGSLLRSMMEEVANSLIHFTQADYAGLASVLDFQIVDFSIYNQGVFGEWGTPRTNVSLSCSLYPETDAGSPTSIVDGSSIKLQFNQSWICYIYPEADPQMHKKPYIIIPVVFMANLISSVDSGFGLFIESAEVGQIISTFLNNQTETSWDFSPNQKEPDTTNELLQILRQVTNQTIYDLFVGQIQSGFVNSFPVLGSFLCPWPSNNTVLENNDKIVITFFC